MDQLSIETAIKVTKKILVYINYLSIENKQLGLMIDYYRLIMNSLFQWIVLLISTFATPCQKRKIAEYIPKIRNYLVLLP